ncbi:MAG TPA: hypothetical protein VM532_14830 [Burkholderiales bacterium]|jgi:hypothetical protein|nr:hypothetical protein [Burkholderiales bacterium]
MERKINSLPVKAWRSRLRQRGVALFVALVMLIAMSLIAVTVVRSMDTGVVIAGNMAFKQASLQATDVGVEIGVAALPDIIANLPDTDRLPSNSTPSGYWYYATQRKASASGMTLQDEASASIETPIDWDQVPIARTINDYDVRVVIDRLCEGPAPVSDFHGKCVADKESGGGSKRPDVTNFNVAVRTYYRITVHSMGPKNSVTVAQAIVGR